MNNFWAVGGGGEHMANALCRLVRITYDDRYLPQFIVIDADNQDTGKSGDTVGSRLKALHDQLGLSLRAKPMPMIWVNPLGGTNGQQRTGARFREMVSAGVADTRATNDVLNALFTQQDQDVDLSFGMRARGGVGATIMQLAASGWDMPSDKSSLKLFDSVSNRDKLVRVDGANHIVAGSCFGGTGAGGIPSISMMLRERTPANMVAFIQAPWFDFKEQSTQADATRERRKQNAAAALQYYLATASYGGRTQGDTIPIRIADFPSEKIALRAFDDNKGQSEHVHGFNVAWAVEAANWFVATGTSDQGVLGVQRGVFSGGTFGNKSGKLLALSCETDPHFRLAGEPITKWLRWSQMTRALLYRGAAVVADSWKTNPEPEPVQQLIRANPSLTLTALSKQLKSRADELAKSISWFSDAFGDAAQGEIFDCPHELTDAKLDMDADDRLCKAIGLGRTGLAKFLSTEPNRIKLFMEVAVQADLSSEVANQMRSKSLGVASVAAVAAAEIERRAHRLVRSQFP